MRHIDGGYGIESFAPNRYDHDQAKALDLFALLQSHAFFNSAQDITGLEMEFLEGTKAPAPVAPERRHPVDAVVAGGRLSEHGPNLPGGWAVLLRTFQGLFYWRQ